MFGLWICEKRLFQEKYQGLINNIDLFSTVTMFTFIQYLEKCNIKYV